MVELTTGVNTQGLSFGLQGNTQVASFYLIHAVTPS